jgi:hypothetical protein
MVKWNTRPTLRIVDARREALDLETERVEELCEEAIELEAESAAPPADDLFEEPFGAQVNGLAGGDTEVLERDGEEVGEVEVREERGRRHAASGVLDAVEVGGEVHRRPG